MEHMSLRRLEFCFTTEKIGKENEQLEQII